MIVNVRASETPRIMACPPSAIPPRIAIDSSDESGRLGTAVHAAVRPAWQGSKIPNADLEKVARTYSVDAEECASLSRQSIKLIGKVRRSFPRAQTEIALVGTLAGGAVVTGHADAMSIVGAEVRVGDLKTGWKTSPAVHDHQMRAYGWLGLQRAPKATAARVAQVFPRDGSVDVQTYSRDDLDAWSRDLDRNLTTPAAITYSVGQHCRYCPRARECPAQAELAKSFARALIRSKKPDDMLAADIEPETLVTLYHATTILQSKLDDFREAMRHRLEQCGPLVADGERIELVKRTRREIRIGAAWEVLTKWLSRDELAEVCSVRKSAMIDAAAKRHNKSPAVIARVLMGQLLNADAVSETTYHVMDCKQERIAPNEIENAARLSGDEKAGSKPVPRKRRGGPAADKPAKQARVAKRSKAAKRKPAAKRKRRTG